MNSPNPRFQPGDTVLLRATNDLGHVERAASRHEGEYWYRVRFNLRVETVVEDDLEPFRDPNEPLCAVAARGAWGQLRAFRTALTVERVTNTDPRTVYSFRAQRVLFQAFQYKPLLKLLESPDRRLLVADEVGLGKTIEAGLALTELDARSPLERVLVVCPSRLREKWRDELSRKFGLEFDIFTRANVDELVLRAERTGEQPKLRAVISMQVLRDSDLRERLLAALGALDAVVVDEAHHARNPGTQTSEMLRAVCAPAAAVLLLTATPLHLGSRDLFTLLHALRPAEFRDHNAFDQVLRTHGGVHEAALRVRVQRPADRARARAILHAIFERGVPPADRNPLAVAAIAALGGAPPADGLAWVELERRVQDLHPLASVLTRTRKRDVQEAAAVREPKVLECVWSAEEERAYRELVHGAGDLGWPDRPFHLGDLQRARQAASCLPAAITARAAALARTEEEAEEVTDLLPGDTGAAPPEPPARGVPAVPARDSKFEKLLEMLAEIDREEPGAKVLVFTFFLGTSRYLHEQLTARGYDALRIAGDVPSDPKRPERDARGDAIRAFRENPTARVLVSTEVGSEGLDFQFCHYLVNYDLPWNPMVVEQRIGRIDRFGQRAAKLHVRNLVVKGTIEDRILYRLYERVGLFRESLGQLEAILGEVMTALQRDYISGALTPEQADRRVADAARAVNDRRLHQEELEKRADGLFGHEEYIRGELNRVDRLGRYLTAGALLAVIRTFVEAHHPKAGLWEEADGTFRLRLTDGLTAALVAAAPAGQWVPRAPGGVLAFCFDGAVGYERPNLDVVNVAHPLVRAAVAGVREQLAGSLARVARAVLPLGLTDEPDLAPGTYFVATFVHVVESIRKRRVLEPVAWAEGRGVLEREAGERLLHLVLERGIEWGDARPAPGMPPDVWDAIDGAARSRNRELDRAEKQENEALYARRMALLRAEYEFDRAAKGDRLRTARERGRDRVVPALQAQLARAEAAFAARAAELERLRKVSCRLAEPIAVCLVSVVRIGT